MAPDAETDWEPGFRVDVRLTLSELQIGRRDPCHRVAPDGSIWRTARLPSGAVTYRLTHPGAGRIRTEAWGPGAAEMTERVPDLLGARDHPERFEPRHPVLEAAARRLTGLRVPRTGLVFEALAPVIFHQKVSGRDAVQSWVSVVRRHGEPAPGPPMGLLLPPTPQGWLDIPQWEWRRAGVEPSAIATLRLVASRAAALDRLAYGPAEEAYRALTSLRGVGPWTAAEVGHRALGDADALPVGDYHLASMTGWALTGAPLEEGDVEEFYERWRPHRYRVVRLLELTPAAWPERRGPRMSRPEHRYGPY